MNAIGPQRIPTEWTARLASLVHTIRPDWDEQGIRSILLKLADRPLLDVALAALTACRRLDQRSPAIIAAAGSHWEQSPQSAPTQSGIRTFCPHGRDSNHMCASCEQDKREPRIDPAERERYLAMVRVHLRGAHDSTPDPDCHACQGKAKEETA